MSLFFYKSWAGQITRGFTGFVGNVLTPEAPIYYTRYGYMALLAITMVCGIGLNCVYLAGYWVCPRAMLEVIEYEDDYGMIFIVKMYF